jgi:REP element-mobilizing transposase RayT
VRFLKNDRQNSKKTPDVRLPLRGSRNPPRRVIIASHLVFTGYAHWLPNDPRGSGSEKLRKDDLKNLGDILHGRQFPQPAREEVREFHREVEPLLAHERIWFKERMRQIIARAFGDAVRIHGYTLWACAICSNHGHAVIRTHRDESEVIWSNLAMSAAIALREAKLFPENHPVWSHRPYKVFLYTPEDVLGRIDYVNLNPVKEGLPRQHWEFVQPYP